MAWEITDISPEERKLLAKVKLNPAMYLGKAELSRFENWFAGYYWGAYMAECGKEHNIWPNGSMHINEYAAKKYKKESREIGSVAGYRRFILHKEPDEEKALQIFWGFLDEYLISLGFEPVPEGNINWPVAGSAPTKENEQGETEVSDLSPKIRTLLASVRKRPGMYLNEPTLEQFVVWLDGYKGALLTAKRFKACYRFLPEGFERYVIEKCGGEKGTPHEWWQFVLQQEPDGKKALLAVFELLDEYLVSLGYAPIPEWEPVIVS